MSDIDDFLSSKAPTQDGAVAAKPKSDIDSFLGTPTSREQDGALVRGFKTAGQSAAITKSLLTGNTSETAKAIRDAHQYQLDNPGTDEGKELAQAWDEGDGITGGIANVGREFTKDWRNASGFVAGTRATLRNLNALREGVVSQLGNSVAPTAGMLAGGAAGGALGNVPGAVAGAWLGGAIGNTLVEGGGQLQSALEKAGINPMDTPAVEKFVAENGDRVLGEAGIKGAIIGGVDTLTAGVAGNLLNAPIRAAVGRALKELGVDAADKAAVKAAIQSGEVAKRVAGDQVYQASRQGVGNIARNTAAAALDPAGEFAGEFVGQGVATGDWNTKDAALEALSSVGQSGAMYAGQKAYQAATNPTRGFKPGGNRLDEPPTAPEIGNDGGTDPTAPAGGGGFADQLARDRQNAPASYLDPAALAANGVTLPTPAPVLDTARLDAEVAKPTPSEAMGLRHGPDALVLENAAALAVDSGASPVANAAAMADSDGVLPEAAAQDATTASDNADLSAWSDADLSTAFQNAQQKEIRQQLARELQRRRDLREQQALQQELAAEQSVPDMPNAPDNAFASVREDAGEPETVSQPPKEASRGTQAQETQQAGQGQQEARAAQAGAAAGAAVIQPEVTDGRVAPEQVSDKAKWIKALVDKSRLNGSSGAQIAATPQGGITVLGDPQRTKNGQALLATYDEARNAGATDQEIAAALAGGQKPVVAEVGAQGDTLEAMRQQLRDVEDKIIQVAPNAMGQGGGDIEAAMKSRKVPVTLKAQRKKLKEQIQQAQDSSQRSRSNPPKAQTPQAPEAIGTEAVQDGPSAAATESEGSKSAPRSVDEIAATIHASINDRANNKTRAYYDKEVARGAMTAERAEAEVARALRRDGEPGERSRALAQAIADKDPRPLVNAWAMDGKSLVGSEGSAAAFEKMTGVKLARLNATDRAQAIFGWAGWTKQQADEYLGQRRERKQQARQEREAEDQRKRDNGTVSAAERQNIQLGKGGEVVSIRAYVDGLIAQGFDALHAIKRGAVTRHVLANKEGRGHILQSGPVLDYARVALSRKQAAIEDAANPAQQAVHQDSGKSQEVATAVAVEGDTQSSHKESVAALLKEFNSTPEYLPLEGASVQMAQTDTLGVKGAGWYVVRDGQKISPQFSTKQQATAYMGGMQGEPNPEHERLRREIAAAAKQATQKTAAPTDFIPAPDGGLDYGEITPEMGQAMRRQAGKIRLEAGDDSYGERHIELRHGKDIRDAGFSSVAEFVSDIASHIDQIWKPSTTAQMVAIHRVGNDRVMYVELRAARDEAGDYYTVRTAFPSRRDFVKNKGWNLLWEGRAQPPADSGSSAPFAAQPSNESGRAVTIPSGSNSDNVLWPESEPQAKATGQPSAFAVGNAEKSSSADPNAAAQSNASVPVSTPQGKLTTAEAKSLMAWVNLGQKDGVQTHILTFYESQADKDALRGRMTIATVTKGDRSASNWMVDGDDKPLAVLGMAKKRAEDAGMAKLVADGYVGEAPTTGPKPARITPDIAANMKAGDVVVDEDGKEYRAHAARHKWLEAHPIENGKAKVSADTLVTFHLDPQTASGYPERSHKAVFLKEEAAENNPFADYNALAQEYGFEVRPDGAIGSDGKFPGPKMKVKGGRLRIESGSGDLLASYASPAPQSLGKFLESFWYAQKKAPVDGAGKTAEPASDRDHFTLERLNRETDAMEPVTFERGEYVRYRVGSEDHFGEIDGISHARGEFSVDGLWYAFGFANKAERPATPARSGVAPLSSVIDKMNAKHGAGLTDADRVPPTSPVDAHEATMQAVREGKATPEQFKASFEAVLAKADAIRAELSAKTKAQLLEVGGPQVRGRHANSTKPDIVDAVYHEMLRDYALGETITHGLARDSYQNAVRRMVEATDADKLAQFVKEREAELQEVKARGEARAQALESPQSLNDYRQFVAHHMQTHGETRMQAFMRLTPEQRVRYDALEAEGTKAQREQAKATAKTAVAAAGQAVAGEVIATKHTKLGHDLFVVQLAERVSREDYETLNASAKRIGGSYSSYRGNGAVPGFQFRTREAAQAFQKLVGGDTQDAKAVADARRDAFEDDRSQSGVQRLRAMAQALDERADASLGQERKANTARRARFAASAEAAARADKALAATMRNLAAAIEAGKAKFLDAVRQKVQVQALGQYLRSAKDAQVRARYDDYGEQQKHLGDPVDAETVDHAVFPSYTAMRSDLASVARQMLEVDGLKKLGARLEKVADEVTAAYTEWARQNLTVVSQFARGDQLADFASREDAERALRRSGMTGRAIVLPVKRGHNRIVLAPGEAMRLGLWTGDGDKRITLSSDFGRELVEALGRRAGGAIKLPWTLESALEKRKRLESMGIFTAAEFRSALREFADVEQGVAMPDKVKELERSMVGRRADGLDFFPTSAAVVDDMLAAAEIEPGMAVLEPSAGMGHIADAIRDDAGVTPDVVELSGERRELLEAKGHRLVGEDFMAMQRGEGYDRIIMNPPFSKGRDIEHVRHAYSLLKPGGRVVAIMGEGAFFQSNKNAEGFRQWLDELGASSERLPEGSFTDPSLPVNTGANARMVVIDKPAVGLPANDGARTANSAIRAVGDAAPAEASRIQAAIEGKGLIGAARFLTQSSNQAHAEVAQKVLEKLLRLENAGVELKLNIVHRGEMAPAAMANSRGYTETGFDSRGRDIVVWLNGADVTGKVGVEEEVLLHELVHAATAGMVFYGTSKPNSLAGKHVRDLSAVTDAIAAHITRRFKDADAGNTTLTEFERDMRAGANNAFRNDDEVLAWALSNAEAQQYLEGIPYKSESLWSAFVGAVRRLLGLSERGHTVLSEVLRVADRLMTDDAPDAGRAAFWHKRGLPMVTQQGRGSLVFHGAPTRTEAGDDGLAGSEETDAANSEGRAQRRPGTAQDKAVIQAMADGKSARDILRLIASQSRQPFNRQVARLLLKAGITPNVVFGHIGKSRGNPIHGQYKGSNDTLYMAGSAEFAAERIFLHEAMHAATLRALKRKGLHSIQLRRLYEHVKGQQGVAGFYGIKNIDEFVAEVFTNPDFQNALRGIRAPSGSVLKTAWDAMVRVLRSILGLSNDAHSALSHALSLGVEVVREDMLLRRKGMRGVGSANAGADTIDQTQTESFKRWFAGSKAVDADGKALVVYHGTHGERTVFEPYWKQLERDAMPHELKGNGSIAQIYRLAKEEPEMHFFAAESGTAESYGPDVVEAYLKIDNMVGSPDMDRDEAIQLMLDQDADGAIFSDTTSSGGHGGVAYVVRRSSQIKSAAGNRGTFDPQDPDIRHFGVDDFTRMKSDALGRIDAAMKHPGTVSLWDKTVGTMRNLAERNPLFKPVYEAAQRFIDDVAMLANDAADMAPRVLPRVDTWRDLAKRPINAADNKALAKPLFEGTLLWARDEQGKPTLVNDLEGRYASLSSDEKARKMLDAGRIDPGVLRMWQGLPKDQFDTLIESRFKSQMLKPGVVWSDKELASIFKMTPNQISLYRETRKAIDRSIDMTARADMLRALGTEFADMRDVVLEQDSLGDAMELVISELQEQAKANPDDSDRLMQLHNQVVDRATKARDLMDAGYAPLSRFGRYTVDVVDASGERQYFGMYESKADSNRAKLQLQAAFPGATVTQGTMSNEAFKLFSGITPESLELFGNMLGLDEEGGGARDRAFQEYLKLTKNNHSAIKRLIHRQGIAGFSEDVGRVLASFVYSNARQAAGGLNAGTMDRAVNAIPKSEGELKDVAMGLRGYIQDPQEEGQAVRGMLFAQYLGGSVASAFVNMTQPFAVTMPWLSQFGGIRGASAKLAQALKDMGTKGFKYEAELAQALKHAEDDGVVSPQEIHQLMAQARGSGSLRSGDGTRVGEAKAAASNAWERTKVAWGQPFALAEQFNRRLTFIAAYRIAKERKMADPAQFARRAVEETQFVYSKANKMRWGRGAIGGALMTFKSYSIQYLELLHRMWTQGGPQGKKAVGFAMVTLLLMGGAGGLPFMEDLEDLIDGIAQLMGINISSKQKRQEFLRSVVGKGLADFMEQGVSGLPGAPVDVSGRLGLGNLIPSTGLFMNKQNRERDLLELAGPAGDLIKRGFTGGRKLLTGDVGGAAMEVAPTAVRNVAKGIDMATSGMYKDAKGYKIIDTTLDEALAKAAGFQPKSVAEVQEANSFMMRSKSFYQQVSAEIKAQWADALFRKDENAVQRVRERLAKWNRDNPDQPIIVKMPDVWKRVREMGKDRTERIAATAPKALRQQMREIAQAM